MFADNDICGMPRYKFLAGQTIHELHDHLDGLVGIGLWLGSSPGKTGWMRFLVTTRMT